jgi:cytochrome c oxidase assembly protein subunit 15
VIFIGGLVRVSGAGLGCPDWPKCFGRWIPPTNASQLPSYVDPSLFNFTLAWIEYFNRLAGMLVGILILITAILAFIHYRHIRRILWPSIAALILVAYQGWQGGQVIATQLKPLLVSVHAVIALAIASLLVFVTHEAYRLVQPPGEQEVTAPEYVRPWIAILWLGAIVQVLLGTQVRSALEGLTEKFPLFSEANLLIYIGAFRDFHMALGALLGAVTIVVGIMILRKSRQAMGLVREGAWAMMILILAQLVIGIVLLFVGMPALMEVFHLWVASLYVGILLLLFSAFSERTGGDYASED